VNAARKSARSYFVACSKCDWRTAFSRDELIASHGADYAMPNLLDHLAAPSCSRLGSNWDRCGVHYVEPIEGARTAGEIHGFEVLRQPYCLKVSTRRARA
jgi:hypothetical protein